MTDLQPFFIREQVIKACRSFFDEMKFHEVITPVLNRTIPFEENLFPFTTTWNRFSDSEQLFLSTSPEAALKKLLGEGIGNCYAIGKSFRNLEASGSHHHPEFLMLEWYREDSSYQQIMSDVKELVKNVKSKIDIFLGKKSSPILEFQNQKINLNEEWQVLSLVNLFRTHAQKELSEVLEDEKIREVAKEKGYMVEDSSWSQIFDQILLNEIEPHFPQAPFFLTDFPSKVSPLCQPQKNTPYLAERFEFFIFGKELGNGNTEGREVEKIRDSIKKEITKRKLPNDLLDESFLGSLEKMSHQKYAGIGLGIDRLAMIMANVKTIDEVTFFHQ
jgi:elongation factor P--beta-lysine ligase